MVIIPEDSKIVIYDKSFDTKYEGIKTVTDMKVTDNSVMLLEGYLCCTDYNCVKKIDEGVYQINVYSQDAFCISDNVLYKSTSDID